MKTVKILLVDDHPLIRDGIKHILSLQKKFIPEIDEADSGKEAIEKTFTFDYDIIIMDIQMPNKDGIEATKAILKRKKNAKILALSMFDETHYIHSMLNAGAMGYVVKATGPEELSKAIMTLLDGKNFYSNEIAIKLLDTPLEPQRKKRNSRGALSEREIEIIKMIASEFTSDEIASKLFISKRTVESHRFNIMKKLGLKNMTGITKYALIKNWVNPHCNH